MSRFIALRPLKTSSGQKQAGDVIPEAKDWPVHILMSEIAVGHVKDLHQVFKCPPHLGTQKREAGLLKEMAARGIVVEPHPDEPGHLVVTRTEAADDEGDSQDEVPSADEAKAEKPKRKGGRPKKVKPAPEAETTGADNAPDADGDADAD